MTRLRSPDPGITHEQRQVILGSLLGDMCIMRRRPSWNAHLQIKHSIKQKEYVEWKYNALKNIVSTPPKMYIQSCGFMKGRGVIGFHTRSLPCLTEIHDIMGTREITQRGKMNSSPDMDFPKKVKV